MMDNLFLSKKYNRQAFLRFINEFLSDDYCQQEKPIDVHNRKQNFITEAICLGKCKSLGLEVYEIHHTSLHDARVGISRDAFNLLLHHSFCNHALVAFVPADGEQWRFSLIEMDAEIDDQTNRIKRSFSNPRRYSFLLGSGAKVKTPQQYIIEKGKVHERAEGNKPLSAWDDLKSRFSVEVLTKEFYEQLFHWYLWAVDENTGVTFPNRTETIIDDRFQINERIIRLITRLLFVWFIKQKNLIPEELFDETYLNAVLEDFDPSSANKGSYYNAILQNLFFATLNQEIDKRKFINDFKDMSDKWSVKSLYRDDKDVSFFRPNKRNEVFALMHKVPYMNSALFDCLDTFELIDGKLRPIQYYDGFSSNGIKKQGHYKYRAFIPNKLFFGKEESLTVVLDTNTGETKEIHVKGLINIFKEYNFTIEENTPSDIQVSLDPELLGRVFENLLAAYNPETGTTVRKSTGSFYTPREIVDYMVEETLIAHLITKCGCEHTEAIRALVKHNEVEEGEFGTLPKQQIIESLKAIKVLDPACGSGAFPMGCLLKICSIIETLEQTDSHDRYTTKLDIIKNCIFGVDIQPIAMMISKLRFFISLLCEQEPNLNDAGNNYGIDPLPNLDTKFVAANTLMAPDIYKFKEDLLVEDDELKVLQEKLHKVRTDYISVRTKEGKKSNRIQEDEIREQIRQHIMANSGAPDEQKIGRLQLEISRCEAEMAHYQGEKIEETCERIQNLFGDVTERVIRRDLYKEKRTELEQRIRSCKSDIQREKNKTNPAGFSAAVQQVTQWNPYDQNQSSPYFDAEWMFGVNTQDDEGFDIVIGNPPYISAQSQVADINLCEQRKKIIAADRYATLYQKWDLYIPFMELGTRMLLKRTGIFSMIVPFPFTNQLYAQRVRELFIHEYNMFELVDLKGTKVFENATVSNCIPFIQKIHPLDNTTISKVSEGLRIYKSFKQPYSELVQGEEKFVWNLTTEHRDANRHSELNVLGDYCYISKGMVINADENTAKGSFKKEDLISLTKDKIHCRTYIEGKDIEAYKIKRERYLEYDTKRCPDLLSRPTFRELYLRPRILFNILGTLVSTIDNGENYVHNDSIICAVLWKDLKGINNKSIEGSVTRYSKFSRKQMEKLSQSIGLKYLLGVLNCTYINSLLADIRGGGLRIYPEHVRNIPIPVASTDIQQKIESLVDKILEGKKAGATTDAWEAEIDEEVYKLYGVNPT